MGNAVFHGQGDLDPTKPVAGNPAHPYAPGNFGNAPGTPNPDAVPPPMPPSGGAYVGPPTAAAAPLPGDWSLQDPGAAEQMFEDLRSVFMGPSPWETMAGDMIPGMAQPGAGQNFWQNIGSQLTGNTGAGNVALQEYQNFARRRPDIATDPGLGAYYDNAKRRALESVGQQSAAAGGYGSSVMQDVGAETVTNLEAERANREADYNLRRLAEDRAYGTAAMMGAGNAAQNQLGWATGLGNIAMGAEEAGLAKTLAAINAARGLGHDEVNRATTGMNAASVAQNAREGRIGGAFDDVFKFGGGVGNAAGGTYNSIIDDSFSIEDAIMQYLTGEKSAGVRESESDAAEMRAGLKDLIGFLQGGGFGGIPG